MNLYLRLAWTLLRCLFLPAISPTDTLVVRRRVWINDIDINLHMNNGRYLTVVDLSLIEFFARTGIFRAAIKQKWRPMAGGSTITFRKGLTPFQSYELRFRWICSAGPWNYMSYEFVRANRIHAAGILKGGMVGKRGLIGSDDAMQFMPKQLQDAAKTRLNSPAPAEVIAWQQSEGGLYATASERIS